MILTEDNTECLNCGKRFNQEYPWHKYCSIDCRSENNYKQRKLNRRKDIVAKFGITVEEYERLLERQGGVCAICKKPETATHLGKIKHLAVDHDHLSKKVRGLLCQRCNQAVGYIESKAGSFYELIVYLGKATSFQDSFGIKFDEEGFCTCGCGLMSKEYKTSQYCGEE